MTGMTAQSEATALAAILIVDDDLEDVQFIKRAFKKNNVANPLFSVFSGEEALDFLHQCDKDNQTYPGLILLDLNMPGVGGIETLRRFKLNERWRRIPAVASSSQVPASSSACPQAARPPRPLWCRSS